MDKILIKNKLTDFIRVGCMMTHLIDGDNIGGKIIEKLTGNTNYKADQFSFSFGLKEVSMEALTSTEDGFENDAIIHFLKKP